MWGKEKEEEKGEERKELGCPDLVENQAKVAEILGPHLERGPAAVESEREQVARPLEEEK